MKFESIALDWTISPALLKHSGERVANAGNHGPSLFFMKTNRRGFVKANLLGGLAAALPCSVLAARAPRGRKQIANPRYAKLDEILRQSVLKRELFKSPILIESLELLRYKDDFLCRVRSRDGAEGFSVGHSGLKSLYPLFLYNLHPFFI